MNHSSQLQGQHLYGNLAAAPDPAFPRLRHVWDSAFMREVFRNALQMNSKRTMEVENCIVHRFRYREGIRAIMLYELHLVEPTTGLRRTLWASGSIYRGDKAKRIYDKLCIEHSDCKAAQLALPFEPVSFVGDLKMLVQVFPFDRHLPTLPALMAGPAEVEPLLLERFGSGDWQAQRCYVDVVRYRPGLGATLRFEVQALDAVSDRQRTKFFYVKVYRSNEGKKAYDLLAYLHGFCEAEKQCFTVPRPIAYVSDLRALVMDRAPGRSFEDIMVSGGDVEAAARRVAKGLAALNRSSLTLPRRRSREEVLRRARSDAAFLQWGCPELRRQIQKILGTIETRLEEVAPAPAHLDVKPDHVFLDGDRVIFIDSDSCAAADPILDPARLLAHLDAMPDRVSVSRNRVEIAASVFTEEYFARVPSEWRRRLAVHYACAILKAALYFLQHQDPHWPNRIAAMIASAQAALGRSTAMRVMSHVSAVSEG